VVHDLIRGASTIDADAAAEMWSVESRAAVALAKAVVSSPSKRSHRWASSFHRVK
jgi:hypothetical protein